MGLFDFLKKSPDLPVSPELDEQYNSEPAEIIALTMDRAGASRSAGEKLWQANQPLIGYIDLQTGTVHTRSYLRWNITEKQRSSTGKGLDLKSGQCFRLLVRPSRERVLYGKTLPAGHDLYVLRVLERNCSDQRLTAMLEEYRRPVTLDIEGGTLTLVRRFGVYEGEINRAGFEFSLNLDADEIDSINADIALGVLESMSDLREWDRKARRYAAESLLESANDWRDENEPVITAEDFARRIEGSPSLSVSRDGEIQFVYSDDDIFNGHWIVVSGTAAEGFDRADIEG